MTINVCIVGCGNVATWRANVIQANPELRVASTVDPNYTKATKLAMSFRQAGHNTHPLTELDDPSNYDLAIIQTPNGLHYKCAEPFIKAGVPVVVEKPLALSWQDMELFEQASDSSWICGAYNSRFSSGVKAAYDKSRDQKIVHIISDKIRHRKQEYYQDGWHGTWALDGGVLSQQAIHCIDLVCWAAGRAPTQVAALGFNRMHDIECEDTGTVLMDFGDFAGTVFGTTGAGRNGSARFDIITTQGIYGTKDWGWDDGAGPLWYDITYALLNKQPPPVPVQSTLPGLQTLHAAYNSIQKSGEWVAVGSEHERLGK